MIRRRYVKKNIASNHPDLGLPKGPTRRSIKDARKFTQAAYIGHIRAMVWRRSGDRCEVCGCTEAETARDPRNVGCPQVHEMHEIVSRAKTRGRPMNERFSTALCLRACPICHRAITANTIALVVGDKGANGFVKVVRTVER